MVPVRGLSRWLYGVVVSSRWPRRRRRMNGAPIFCFHNVVADEYAGRVGDGALHMGVSAFEEHLTWIARTYSVIALAELVERLRAGRSVRGVAALTLDDAYQGALTYGLPVLRALQLPATLFVVAASADSSGFFWWDRLGGGGSSGERRRYLEDFRGDARLILGEVEERSGGGLPDICRPAGWAPLRDAARDGLFAMAAHGVSHRHLQALSFDELRFELEAGRAAIGEHVGVAPTLFAYPYGLADDRAVRAVAAAGYNGAVTLARAVARPGQHPLALPRINVPAGIAPEALESWAAEIWLRPPPIRMPGDGSAGAVASPVNGRPVVGRPRRGREGTLGA